MYRMYLATFGPAQRRGGTHDVSGDASASANAENVNWTMAHSLLAQPGRSLLPENLTSTVTVFVPSCRVLCMSDPTSDYSQSDINARQCLVSISVMLDSHACF
jgi:hypothetical protein